MRYLVSSLLTLPLLISCTTVQQEYYAPGFYQATHHYQGQVLSQAIRGEMVHHGHGTRKRKAIVRHPETHAQVQQNVHGHDTPKGVVHGHTSPAVNGVVIHPHSGSVPVQAKNTEQHRHT